MNSQFYVVTCGTDVISGTRDNEFMVLIEINSQSKRR